MIAAARPTPNLLARIGDNLSRLVGRRARDLIPNARVGFTMNVPVVAGVVVTPQTALTFTAVFGAINVISTDVAKLPFELIKTTRAGASKPATNDPRHRLIAIRPNPEMNAMRYRQCQMGHVLGWGNHYSEIVRDGSGMPTALWPLHPGAMRPMRDSIGAPLYYEDSQTGRRFRPEDVIHIAGLGFDGICGYSPIMLAKQAIGLGMAAESFGGSMFGNGARPGGILKTAKKLSDQGAKNLRQMWEQMHSGSANANRTAVLHDGLEWVETQISPEAAQFLATRQFQVLEIARIFNLPPHKIGDYSQSHLANVEESNMDYLTSTLQGWLEAIEAEYNTKLLFEDEQQRLGCVHDMSALLRGNMAARGEFYKALRGIGVINADSIAAREGLPVPGPANGGDLYLIQSQNIPVQDAGKPAPAPKPAPRPPMPDPTPEPEPEPEPEPSANGVQP